MHQIPVPTMYSMTIFEKFLVRPYFFFLEGGGGAPGDGLPNLGISKGLPYEFFEPKSTKNTVIKFFSNLLKNSTELPDYNGKTGLNCNVDAWSR